MTWSLSPSRSTSAAPAVRVEIADTEIARTLALAFAVAADTPLREMVRGVAGATADAAFAMRQPGGSAWLIVESNRIAAARHRPAGMPVVDHETLHRHAPGLAAMVQAAFDRTTVLADAAALVGALLGPAETPSRQAFAALLPWRPVIEQMAFKTAASLAVTLDFLRPRLVADLRSGDAPPPALLNEYWQRVHAAAQLVLLASEDAARPWLVEMSGQFAWVNWTPTFTLLRERTTWLAACAARSAAAYGAPVVGKYLAVLEAARHPFKVFDALFGLAAIALGDPPAAAAIAAEIRSLRRWHLAGEATPSTHVVQAYADALDLIEGNAPWAGDGAAEVAALGWRSLPPQGLATPVALRTDPAVVTRSGHLLGFAVLPTVLATPVALFNPDRTVVHPAAQATASEIVAEVLRGAWTPIAPAARVLH
jgi:hypothetical protein